MSGLAPNVFSFRPGTASGARPGTSSGRRHLDSVSNQGNSIQESCQTTIQREVASDNLLRILNYDNTMDVNQVMMYAEKGNVKNFSALVAKNNSVISCHSLLGFTPLHHACSSGQIAIIEEILKYDSQRGALVNETNDAGETPLHLAVYAGRYHAVQLLLKMPHINIDALNNDNETALFYAARQSNIPLIRLLLRSGLDASITDKYDDSALDHCKSQDCTDVFSDYSKPSTRDYFSSLSPTHLALIYSYLSPDIQVKWKAISKKLMSQSFVVKSNGVSRTNSGRSIGNSGEGSIGSSSGKRPPSKPYHRTPSESEMNQIRALAVSPPVTAVPGTTTDSSTSKNNTNSTSCSGASSSSSAANRFAPPSVWRAMTPTNGCNWEGELSASLGFEPSATSTLLSRPAQAAVARKKSSSFTGNIPPPPSGG